MAWSHDARSCTCVSQYYFPYIKGTKYGTKLQKIEKANAQTCLPLDCGRAGCFHPFWENGCFAKPRKKEKFWTPLQQVGLGRLLLGSRGGLRRRMHISHIFVSFFSVKSIDVFICMICELTGLNAVFRLLNVHGGIAYCVATAAPIRGPAFFWN